MFYGTSRILLLLLLIHILLFYVAESQKIRNLTEAELADNAAYRSNKKWFHCGSGEKSQFASAWAIGTCQNLIHFFNLCCAAHDDCYELQLEKAKCDKDFYDCNKKAADEYAQTWDFCTSWVEGSYIAMASSDAHDAYYSSILDKYKGPFYIPKYGVMDVRSQYFSDYYKYCEFHRLLVSTCAYNLEKIAVKTGEYYVNTARSCIPKLQDGQMPLGECKEATDYLRWE